MAGLGYTCALVLAAVFVRAAVAKAVRPAETAAGFAALEVPAPPVTSRVVPAVELVLAIVLLAAPRAGGGAALVLLAAFSAFVGRALHRGVSVPCNCFGSARAEPVSRIDLLRNLFLGGLAVAALIPTEPLLPEPWEAGAAFVVIGGGVTALRAARRAARRPRLPPRRLPPRSGQERDAR